MKYVAAILLLAVGIGIGYMIGSNKTEPLTDDAEPQTEYITQTVVDTVIQKEQVRIPIAEEEEFDSTKVIPDSLIALNDSLDLIIPLDTLSDDISIRREKLVDKRWLSIAVLEENDNGDSLVNAMMEIEDNLPSKILVEFWESPLNFEGYKLSRSKLVLYGMSPGLQFKLYRKRMDYYLSAQTFYYSLKETEEFLPYLEVSKDVVFND